MGQVFGKFSCVFVSLWMASWPGICRGNSENAKAFLDVRAILNAWEASFGAIKAMKFEYSWTHTMGGSADGATDPIISRSHAEKIQDGKLYHVRYSNVEKDSTEKPSAVFECAFDGKAGKRYEPMRRAGRIESGRVGPMETTADVENCMMIGRRQVPSLREEFPEGVPYFSLIMRQWLHAGWAKVLPDLEDVAGEACHVIEIRNPENSAVERFWIAHAKGMLILKHKHGHSLLEVQDIAKVVTDTGEFWYPSDIHREWRISGTETTEDLKIHEFVPHVKVSPDTFDITFPNGTVVSDLVTGTYYVVGGPNVGPTAPSRDPNSSGPTKSKPDSRE